MKAPPEGTDPHSQDHRHGVTRPPWFRLLLTICPINLMMSLDKQVIGLASPLIAAEMHFSIVQVSVIIAAAYWSYALLQIPSGWLVERFGYRQILFGSLLCWGTITLFTVGANGFAMFLLMRIALGFGQAPDWPAAVVAIKRWFEPDRRPLATSLALSSLYLGPIVGGPIAVFLFRHGGWRSCLLLYGLLGLVMAALWWLFAPRDVAMHQEPTPHKTGSILSEVITVLRVLQLRALCLCYFLLVGLNSFYNTLYPQYITSGRSLPLLSSGMLLSAPFLGLYAATLASGRAADIITRRMRSRRRVSLILGIAGIIMATGGMALLLWAPAGWPLGASGVLSMAGCGTLQVMLWSTVQSRNDASTGTTTGCIAFWGNLATGTIPILMATIQRKTSSWNQAMIVPIALGVLLFFAWPLALGNRNAPLDS